MHEALVSLGIVRDSSENRDMYAKEAEELFSKAADFACKAMGAFPNNIQEEICSGSRGSIVELQELIFNLNEMAVDLRRKITEGIEVRANSVGNDSKGLQPEAAAYDVGMEARLRQELEIREKVIAAFGLKIKGNLFYLLQNNQDSILEMNTDRSAEIKKELEHCDQRERSPQESRTNRQPALFCSLAVGSPEIAAGTTCQTQDSDISAAGNSQ